MKVVPDEKVAPSPIPATCPAAPGGARVRVRERREALGLRSGELAARAGMTRQALHSVERGSYLPGILVALRLARALDCRVEQLFALDAQEAAHALLVGEAPLPVRVQLATVAGRRLAFPVAGDAALSTPADALAVRRAPGAAETWAGEVELEDLGRAGLADTTAVLVGCDPALGLLAAALPAAEGRLLWREQSSTAALRSLARGEAHLAGIHLWNAAEGESNRAAATRELPGRRVHLYSLWTWTQGLMVAPGNPQGLTGPADLARPGLRVVSREPGAGSRLLLDGWCARAGVTPTAHWPQLSSHLEVARAVQRGEADTGPGPRSAALAWGLDFLPIQLERFDLVVPDEQLRHPVVAALLAQLHSPQLRQQLAATGGCDPAAAGTLWQTLEPAG